MSEAQYLEMVFWDNCTFELYQGRLTEKGGGTAPHNSITTELGLLLFNRLENAGRADRFSVRINGGRLRESAQDFYVPDVFVFPTEFAIPLMNMPDVAEVYGDPVNLVCEVWMPPIDGYDHDFKLPAYRRRGDQEIWRVDPYVRTVTSWRRQSDGGYTETTYHGGVASLDSLGGITIDLDALFE